jgi:hypothetical protein
MVLNINLPDVNWRELKMNAPGQLKKIFEEAGEVAEAVACGDPVGTIREALDTIQTNLTLINMTLDEYPGMALDRFLVEHIAKLERKGYLVESPPEASKWDNLARSIIDGVAEEANAHEI